MSFSDHIAPMLLLTGFAVINAPANAQAVYKSVDRDGNISYSDTPPENAAATREVEIPVGPSEEQIKAAQERGREFQESVDRMAKEREQKEAALAEKRRQQEQQRRDRETEERLTRLEELERRDDYRDWGAYYYPHPRPYPPTWGGWHPEQPIAKPLPGLPPVTGLDGTPLFKSRGGRL